MKLRCLGVCLVTGLLSVSPALSQSQAPPSGPGQFMIELGKEVINLVKDKQHSEPERKQAFANLVNRNFDIAGITRFALGYNWRSASVAEREQFAHVFDTYLVDVMWSRFSGYTGQHFVVTKALPLGGAVTIVKSEVVSPNGDEPYKIDWRLANNGGVYKITDVIIDGGSEEIAYRQEFMDIMLRKNGGVHAVISELKQKDRKLGGST